MAESADFGGAPISMPSDIDDEVILLDEKTHVGKETELHKKAAKDTSKYLLKYLMAIFGTVFDGNIW